MFHKLRAWLAEKLHPGITGAMAQERFLANIHLTEIKDELRKPDPNMSLVVELLTEIRDRLVDGDSVPEHPFVNTGVYSVHSSTQPPTQVIEKRTVIIQFITEDTERLDPDKWSSRALEAALLAERGVKASNKYINDVRKEYIEGHVQ